MNASIVNGALELLPESLSTMAIIPLQMKLVYRIGQAYGYELDRGHIKDFLATAGVGMTSQFLEQAGRKLLGGFLGKMGGGMARDIVLNKKGIKFLLSNSCCDFIEDLYSGYQIERVPAKRDTPLTAHWQERLQ